MYLKWKEITTPDLSDTTLTNLYTEGFVLTRKGKGEMDQTRSVRIDLSKFVLSSENRRVLKKTEGLELEVVTLPYSDYSWEIGKLGKDFYEDKFGVGTFSANKIKELLTDPVKSNFNALLLYWYTSAPVGYSIVYQNKDILHYSYPFYDRATKISNLGLGMMLRAIMYAQETGKQYIYLGSAQRPTDSYKLQFAGLEWFDGETWQTATEELKNILTSEKDSTQKTDAARQLSTIDAAHHSDTDIAARHSRADGNPVVTKKPIAAYKYFLQSFFEAILANIAISILVAITFGLGAFAYEHGYLAGFDFVIPDARGASYYLDPYEGISSNWQLNPLQTSVIATLLAFLVQYKFVKFGSWGIVSLVFYSVFVYLVFYFYKKNRKQEDTYYRKNKKKVKIYFLIGLMILMVIGFGAGFAIGVNKAKEAMSSNL